MAVCSSITLSQVEYLRLDADYYQPKYLNELETWRKLDERVGISKLAHLISAPVRTGRTPSLRNIRNDDVIIPFIKTDGIREGWINFESAGELPRRVLAQSDFIRPNSVVVTIIGATPEIVGRAAIVRESDPKCVTNQNVAVISTNGKCDPYFLTAYFQTSWGRDQLWRHSRRTEQVNLNCREVERVLVPVPDISIQNRIGNLVRNSFEAIDKAKLLYVQAQSLLESELGLDKLTFDKPVSYSSPYSACLSEGRIDADYFQPKYLQMRSLIESYPGGYDCLLSYCDVLAPNFDPRKHPKETFKYIELANIEASIGLVEGFTEDLGLNLPLRAKRMVTHGDVIASSVVGSVEKSALITDEDGYLASTGFFHFRPKNISSEFLLVLVRSVFVRMQLQQQATGGILSAVPEQRLCHIVVPRIPKALQDEITLLVRQAHRARKESKRLLDQAKHRVEALIEEAIAV